MDHRIEHEGVVGTRRYAEFQAVAIHNDTLPLSGRLLRVGLATAETSQHPAGTEHQTEYHQPTQCPENLIAEKMPYQPQAHHGQHDASEIEPEKFLLSIVEYFYYISNRIGQRGGQCRQSLVDAPERKVVADTVRHSAYLRTADPGRPAHGEESRALHILYRSLARLAAAAVHRIRRNAPQSGGDARRPVLADEAPGQLGRALAYDLDRLAYGRTLAVGARYARKDQPLPAVEFRQQRAATAAAQAAMPTPHIAIRASGLRRRSGAASISVGKSMIVPLAICLFAYYRLQLVDRHGQQLVAYEAAAVRRDQYVVLDTDAAEIAVGVERIVVYYTPCRSPSARLLSISAGMKYMPGSSDITVPSPTRHAER